MISFGFGKVEISLEDVDVDVAFGFVGCGFVVSIVISFDIELEDDGFVAVEIEVVLGAGFCDSGVVKCITLFVEELMICEEEPLVADELPFPVS